MNREKLVELIRTKKSFLCVGLDTDPDKIPASLHHHDDPVFEFNRLIIDATLPYTVAYKPNLAFYEASGSRGIVSLEKTMDYIRSLPEPVFTIADAKRGDIGNTAAMYARAFFETMNFDAITLSPYMGMDTIAPFLDYPDKWVILLALTSNAGSADFQMLQTRLEDEDNVKEGGSQSWKNLYEQVMEKATATAKADQLMFVVGATQAEMFAEIRKTAPDNFLLVPGVGAQGGSLEEVARTGMNNECGLLVNASRSIIFASGGNDFQQAAAREARQMQEQMELFLKGKGIC